MSACDSGLLVAARALQGARSDQQAERRRHAAGERAEREDDDRDREHPAPPEAVAEASVERHHDDRGEQVGDGEPRGVAQVAQLTADDGRGGREQGLVDGGQEHRHHHRDEEAAKPRAIEVRRDDGARIRKCGCRCRGPALANRRVHDRDADQRRPVEPKPASPRALASNEATMRNSACTTGTITIWAMRSNGSIVNALVPRFQQLTISGPW